MTTQRPAKRPAVDLTDPEIAGALAALKRARVRAEEIAAATGTSLVQAIDGKPVLVRPRPAAPRSRDT